MKPIQKDELYENLSEFLKGKGVQLNEGSYSKGIHAGCSMLADAINLSQAGLEKAKTELERKVSQVRQVIHEKTAPKAPPSPSTASKSTGDAGKTTGKATGSAPRSKATGRAKGSAARKPKGK